MNCVENSTACSYDELKRLLPLSSENVTGGFVKVPQIFSFAGLCQRRISVLNCRFRLAGLRRWNPGYGSGHLLLLQLKV